MRDDLKYEINLQEGKNLRLLDEIEELKAEIARNEKEKAGLQTQMGEQSKDMEKMQLE